MNICYFNGKFLPKDKVRISPDDRGFLFADGIYEVARWYEGFFFDMESHMTRMKRSMKEIRYIMAGSRFISFNRERTYYKEQPAG